MLCTQKSSFTAALLATVFGSLLAFLSTFDFGKEVECRSAQPDPWLGHPAAVFSPDAATGIPNHIARKRQLVQVDQLVPIRRRPAKIVLSSDDRHLLVANQASGSISVLDANAKNVLNEWKVADSIRDLIHWRDNEFLVAAETETGGQLLCLSLTDTNEANTNEANTNEANTNEGSLAIEWALPTVGSPNRILLSDNKAACFVGGLWSRRVARHSLDDLQVSSVKSNQAEELDFADLDFAVGNLLSIEQGKTILVTDAFGSGFATLRANDLKPIRTGDLGARRLPAIANAASSIGSKDDKQVAKLIVVTQPLNRLAQAIRNDVHWGLMVANEIVIKDEDWFLQPDWKESRRSAIPLGGPGEAKGDPESLALSANGEVAVTVGGVNQIAIGDLTERSFAYIPTGRRPVASCFSTDGKWLYVANQVDDSVSVVNAEEYELATTIELGSQPEMTAADRGERLFFDATVSHDSWMSCHSCHVQGHTSGFLNDNFSDQSFGAPKRILSLLGHGDTAPFAWNGSAKTLEDQVRSSIEVTMQTDDDFTDSQIEDLAEFVRRLPAPPSLAKSRGTLQQVDFDAGRKMFVEQLGCIQCHAGDTYTSVELQTVGPKDELGKEEFNPPSLIGVSQRQRFFHDGRYTTLRQIFEEDRHQLKDVKLTEEGLKTLLDYLSTL